MGILAGGLGTMAGTSPFAMANIGAGGLAGLKEYGSLRQNDRENALAQSTIGYKSAELALEQRKADLEWQNHMMTVNGRCWAAASADHGRSRFVGCRSYREWFAFTVRRFCCVRIGARIIQSGHLLGSGERGYRVVWRRPCSGLGDGPPGLALAAAADPLAGLPAALGAAVALLPCLIPSGLVDVLSVTVHTPHRFRRGYCT